MAVSLIKNLSVCVCERERFLAFLKVRFYMEEIQKKKKKLSLANYAIVLNHSGYGLNF